MRRLRLKALAFIMFVAGAASMVMTILAYGAHLTTPGGASAGVWFAASLTAAFVVVGIGALAMLPLAGRRRSRRNDGPATVGAEPPDAPLPTTDIRESRVGLTLPFPDGLAIHVAVLLVATAGLAVVAFQFANLMLARDVLNANVKLLEGPFNDSQQLARQLDGLAGGTAQLALSGHPIARKIVDDMRNAGVNLNPPKPAQ